MEARADKKERPDSFRSRAYNSFRIPMESTAHTQRVRCIRVPIEFSDVPWWLSGEACPTGPPWLRPEFHHGFYIP